VVLEACASLFSSTAGASIAQERLMEVTGDAKSFQKFVPRKSAVRDPRLTVSTVDVTLYNQTTQEDAWRDPLRWPSCRVGTLW
jgi:hypothetical protein